MSGQRIRGVGLLVVCLRRYAPTLNPSYSRKRIGENAVYISPTTFGLQIERDFCASVRGCSTWHPGETNALANSEFPTQRASSLSRRSEVAPYGYVVVLFSNLRKALGISVTTGGLGMTFKI